MKKPQQIKLRKIPLEPLIDTLMELYSGGVEFIDIVGTQLPYHDILNILVQEEYITEEQEDIPLSDETLNQLI